MQQRVDGQAGEDAHILQLPFNQRPRLVGHLAANDGLEIAEFKAVRPIAEQLARRASKRADQHGQLAKQDGHIALVELTGVL